MDFGNVLSRAWQIIWKHKVLWIFGILAGCSGNSGFNVNWRSSYRGDVPQQVQPYIDRFQNMSDGMIAAFVIGAILLGLIFIVVTVFLGTMGRIGRIRGTHQVEGSATSLAFGDLFNGSMRYFWRVFGLNLLVGLLVFLAVIILVVVFVFGSIVTLGLFALCAIPLVCLGVPIGWVISVVVEQASIAIVLEDLGIVEGLNRGWAVVKANVGPMILMWLVLGLGVGGIGGFILAIPVFVIVVPAMVGVMSQSQTATSGGLLVAGLCFVAYLPVLIVLNGILRGYIETAWTLTFMRLTNRPAAAALAAVEEIPPAA
jgi:hypothetical protein